MWENPFNVSKIKKNPVTIEFNINTAKYKELGYDQEPLAFNVSHSFLTDEVLARGFGFTFGETKPMLDWFDEDFYNV